MDEMKNKFIKRVKFYFDSREYLLLNFRELFVNVFFFRFSPFSAAN